jgi:acetyl esterase
VVLKPEVQTFLAGLALADDFADDIVGFRESLPIPPVPAELRVLADVEDHIIGGSDGHDVRVRMYRPKDADSERLPVLVWAHGGSFIRGTIEAFELARLGLAVLGRWTVVAVDQRLAPETRFPHPIEDVYTALAWAYDRFTVDDISPVLAACGESSGANLAAAAALLARQRGGPEIAWQILIVPTLDAALGSETAQKYGEGYGLTRSQLVWCYQQYAPDADPKDPLLSPLYADDVADAPSTVIVTAQYDPLRGDGERLADKLRASRRRVLYEEIPGAIHHFLGHDGSATVLRIIGEALGQPAPPKDLDQ